MKRWKCIEIKSGREVLEGSSLEIAGTKFRVMYLDPPHKETAEGKIGLSEVIGAKFASALGCKFVEIGDEELFP